jgi:hypothetical protein
MQIEKKIYETPKVTTHGTVTELTLKGGGLYSDVPEGTPIAGITVGSGV